MKRLAKAIVVAILGWQVRRLCHNNKIRTVGIVGSYGKTSTKLAVAELLEAEFQVQYQRGNYNDTTSVPLVFFGHDMPSLFNPFAWLFIFFKNERIVSKPYPYDAVILELGIDGPGQMKQFGKFLELDTALVTSIGPEHMENFKSIQDVAKEELTVGEFTKYLFINGDLCNKHLLKYAKKSAVTYHMQHPKQLPFDRWTLKVDGVSMLFEQKILSKARMYTFGNAAVVARALEIPEATIHARISKIKNPPGRMNVLKGKSHSLIIDDSYNASPEATILALQTLYAYPAKQRIALLGNMNELGSHSEQLHRQVGEACNGEKLDMVVTLGEDANTFLANAARDKGCEVKTASTPYQAGKIIEKMLKTDTVVLVKGSQNGVFAEEAIKFLLHDQKDSSQLIRQSKSWIKKKRDMFHNFDPDWYTEIEDI